MPVLLPVVVATGLAPGQSPDESPAEPLRASDAAGLRGVIVDAATGLPVPGAQVQLVELGRTAQSRADGAFAFDDLTPGRHSLTVSLIGYIFVRRQVALAPGANVDLTVPVTGGAGAYQETVSVRPAPKAGTEPGSARRRSSIPRPCRTCAASPPTTRCPRCRRSLGSPPARTPHAERLRAGAAVLPDGAQRQAPRRQQLPSEWLFSRLDRRPVARPGAKPRALARKSGWTCARTGPSPSNVAG